MYILRIRYVSENQTNNDYKSQICYDVASSTDLAPYMNSKQYC